MKPLFCLATTLLCRSWATCPQGALQGLTANDCYFYSPPATWMSALEDCVSRGGQLVSVLNAFVNSFLPTLPTKTCGNPYDKDIHGYWIGASIGLTSSNWSWSDGSRFAYTAWGETPGTSTPFCGMLSLTNSLWYARSCTTALPYICKVPPLPNATPPPLNCPPACPSGWTYLSSSNKCYKLVFNVMFDEAVRRCNSLNATLATVHDAVTNALLTDMVSVHIAGIVSNDGGGINAIIGLHDPTHTREWEWLDGSPFDWSNWAPGEPDNAGDVQWCVRLLNDNGQYTGTWDDADCPIKYRSAICQTEPL